MNETPQLLLIEWIDHRQPATGWQRLAEIETRGKQKCISVGFLVREDAQAKVIAPNLSACEGDGGWDQASSLITIPVASITKIKQISTFQMSAPRRTPVGETAEVVDAPWARPLADAWWLRRLA